ncbi:MAG: PAS domain S-box protein [Candidatus Bathyarchaeota archaeon]|nr:PAS domain S-box protein [Candidatus Bathyarchaeota archaeon]
MLKNTASDKCNDSLPVLIDLVPDPIALLDSKGKIAYVNKQLESLWGVCKEQIVGKNVTELPFLSGSCQQLLLSNAKKRFAGASIPPYEIKTTASNGEQHCLDVKGTIIKNEGEVFILGLFRDVTERAKTQKELQTELSLSEEKLQCLCNSLRDAIVFVDEKTRVTYWNTAAEKTFGFTREEVLGKNVHDLVVPASMCKEARANIGTCVEIFSQTGMGYFTVGNVELIGRHKDGSEFPVELSLSSINLNGVWHAAGIIKDITSRKRGEQKLKDAEQRYHALFNQAPLGVMVIDPQTGAFLDFNDIAHLQLGYSREEFEKLTLSDIETEKTKQELQALIMDLVRDGSGQFETKHRTKTDDVRNVLITIRAFRSSGRPYLNCICHDITETKKAQLAMIKSEARLRESEELFRAISTFSTDAIILSDQNDKVIYWNPAAEQTFSYPENEAIGKSLTELVMPSSEHEAHKEMLKEILAKPLSKKHRQLNAKRKDGSTFPMDISIVSVTLDGKQCLLSTIRDVTEWKNMEEALRQERDMLENVAANVNAGLAIINREYKIVWANQLLKQLSKKSQVENEYCYKVFPKDSDGICIDCGVQKIFEEGAAIDRHDYHFENPNSGWVELIVTPIKDKEGNVVAALELVVDITERKQQQAQGVEYSQKLEGLVQKRTDQLKRTQAELVKSERLAAIGELASMVGHDLRNPLTGIKNSAYFMKKKGSQIPPDQYREMLETIDKCVDYSNKIVSDLLDYSREIRLNLQDYSPKKLLDESLSILGKPANVKIENNLPYEFTVKLDADKIKRVFVNLLKNAIDAMPNGGKVTVSSKTVPGALAILVTDTGVGISEDVLSNLFVPLFTTKAQGMGFGLAICKRMVEAHGGTITCTTVKGRGTTFTLTLPIQQHELEVNVFG